MILLLFTLKFWVITATGAFIVLVALLKDKRKKEYDDDFASAGEVLSRFNRGFVIDGTRKLTREASFRNVFVQGGVGSGKSQSIAIPFLKSITDASIVVNDSSGELLSAVWQDLRRNGFEIKVVQFRNPNKSAGYNVFARAKTNGEINKVSQLIVQSTLKHSPDQFWNQLSVSLISMLAKALPEEHRNLANIKNLLQLLHARPDTMDGFFSRQNVQLYNSYASFLGYGEKIVSGVTANALASLQILEDDDVARVLSFDTLGDFSKFRKKKTAVFVINNTMDTQYLRFAVDCFFSQLFEEQLSKLPAPTDLDLFLVLDEFGSSMHIPQIGQALATLRKTRTGVLLINQSSSQLENYGKDVADTIRSCCYTKIYLPGGISVSEAQALEKRGGKFEYEDDKGVRRVRELITTAEVLKIAPETGLVDMGNMPLMKVSMTPYFKQFRFRNTVNETPIDIQGGVPKAIFLFNPEIREKGKLYVSG